MVWTDIGVVLGDNSRRGRQRERGSPHVDAEGLPRGLEGICLEKEERSRRIVAGLENAASLSLIPRGPSFESLARAERPQMDDRGDDLVSEQSPDHLAIRPGDLHVEGHRPSPEVEIDLAVGSVEDPERHLHRLARSNAGRHDELEIEPAGFRVVHDVAIMREREKNTPGKA